MYGIFVEKMPIKLTQPDGAVINCFITGDEFYRRVFDDKDYTIIQHETTGYYVYAIEENGKLVSSNYVVGKNNPEKIGLKKGVIVSNIIIQDKINKLQKINNSFQRKIKTDIPFGTSDNVGLINNLVVFIRFSDEVEFTQSKSFYEGIFNGNSSSSNSMYNYFKQASYNKLEIKSHFYPESNVSNVISYKNNQPRKYYQPYNVVTNKIGYSNQDERYQREWELLSSAINYVKSIIPDNLNLDYNSDGVVDNIAFIIKGGSDTWDDLMWPHNWDLYSLSYYAGATNYSEFMINSKYVSNFNFYLSDFNYGNIAGVLCHEMFHALGAPDLYHYNPEYADRQSVGVWDLMDATGYDKAQSMTAYMKFRYGKWIDNIPEITVNGKYTLYPITSSKKNCYKFNLNQNGSEYIVLEYRKKTGTFETIIPGSGMIVSRINTSSDGLGNMDYPSVSDEIYIYRVGGTPTEWGDINKANLSNNLNRAEISNNTNPYIFLSDGTLGKVKIKNITEYSDSLTFFIENLLVDSVPISDFNSERTNITKGDAINFFDKSLGKPNQWLWTFQGATPATSSLQNPINIAYNTSGSYYVKLKVLNSKGADSIVKYNYIIVAEPEIFSCNNAIQLQLNQTFSGSTVGGTKSVSKYNCSEWNESGSEKIHSITLSKKGVLSLELNYADNIDLDLFLLNNCNINSCIASGDKNINMELQAGTYYIVVDGYGNSAGNYNLNVSFSEKDTLICDNATNILVGTVFNGTTSNLKNNIKYYNCANWLNETGGEKVHVFTLNRDVNMKVKLFNTGSNNLDAFIFNGCDINSCISYIDSIGQVKLSAGTYYLVVDEMENSEGSYSLLLEELKDTLICNDAVKISCGEIYKGSTIGLINNINKYTCKEWNESGPEKIHYIQTNNLGSISIKLNSFNEDLDIALIGGCNIKNCISIDDAEIKVSEMPAGIYYIVVDGYEGIAANYEIEVNYTSFKADAGIDKTICSGSNVTLTANGGDNYLWSNGMTTKTILVTPTTNSTYNVSCYKDGCVSVDDVVVMVNKLNIDLGNDINDCNHTDIELQVNPSIPLSNIIYVQTPDNYVIDSIGYAKFGTDISKAYAGGDLIYVQDKDNSFLGCSSNGYPTDIFKGKIALIDRGGCSFEYKTLLAQQAGAKAVIIVNNELGNSVLSTMGESEGYGSLIKIPVVMVGNNDGLKLKNFINNGKSVQLSIGYYSSAMNYSWYPNNAINNVEIANPIVNPTTTTTYNVTVSNLLGCSASDNIVISINNNPIVVDAGVDKTIYSGDSITINSTFISGANYTWSSGQKTSSIKVAPTSNTAYTISVDKSGCVDDDIVYVYVKKIREGQAGSWADSWNYDCSNNTVGFPLDKNTVRDTGYINGNNIITKPIEQAQLFNTTSKNSILTGVAVWFSKKQVKTNQPIYAKLYSLNPTTLKPNTLISISDTIYMSDINTSQYEGGLFKFNSLIHLPEKYAISICLPNSTSNLVNNDMLCLSVTSNNCMTSDSLAIEKRNDNKWYSILKSYKDTINFDFAIFPQINFKDTCMAYAGRDTSICGNSNVTIGSNISIADTYFWLDNHSSSKTRTVAPNNTTNYTLSVSNGYCEDSDAVRVEVKKVDAGEDKTLCEAGFVVLSAKGVDSYKWNTGETNQSIVVQVNDSKTFKVTGTSGNCISTDEIMVDVSENDGVSENWEWLLNFEFPLDDYIIDMAIDNKQFVYSVGSFYSYNESGDLITNSFILKTDSLGNIIWLSELQGDKENVVSAITIDKNNNIVITGVFKNNLVVDGDILITGSNYDIYILQYNQNGILNTGAYSKTNKLKQPMDIVTDANNDIYISGVYAGADDLWGAALPAYGSYDIFISKISSNYQYVYWTRTFGSSKSDAIYSIDVDSAGNLYGAGAYSGSMNIKNYILNSVDSSQDILLVKYDPDGNLLNYKSIGGSGTDLIRNILYDKVSNNIYLAGKFSNQLSINNDIFNAKGATDGILIKMDNNFNSKWIKTIGSSKDDIIQNISINKNGELFFVANYNDSMSYNNNMYFSKGDYDIFISKIDSFGNDKWNTTIGGKSLDIAGDIVVNDKNIYIGGLFYKTISINCDKHYTSGGGKDLFIAKLNDNYNCKLIVDAGLDKTICDGSSINLTANGGTSYSWSNNIYTANNVVSPIKSTKYYVTVTANSCSAKDSVLVTVKSVNANADNDKTICKGDMVLINVSGGTTYSWNTGSNKNQIMVSPSSSSIYFVSAYKDNCFGKDSVNITVNIPPIVDLGSDKTISKGDSITLYSSNTVAIAYAWSNETFKQNATVKPTTTTTYSLFAFDANGCSSSDNIVVNVINPPNCSIEVNIGNDTTITKGNSINIYASIINGNNPTYTWNSGQTDQNILIAPTTNITYIVTVYDGNCSAVDSVLVSVVPVNCTLSAFINAMPTNICKNSTSNLVASVENETSNNNTIFIWSNGLNTNSISVKPMSTTTYTLTVQSGECVTTTSTVVFVTSVWVELDNEKYVCSGNQLTLSALGNANEYLWSNNMNMPTITFIPDNSKYYTLLASIDSCVIKDSVYVHVVQTPEANAGEDVLLWNTDKVQLTASGGDSYLWSTGETSSQIFVNPTQTTIYVVTVANQGLCSDVDSVEVKTPSLSIEELAISKIKLYPNPNNGVFYFELSNKKLQNPEIALFNVFGQEILRKKIIDNKNSKTKIDISNHCNGVYYLELKTNDNCLIIKVIKN
ncbi:MAG: hypothetical protein A2X12_01110 [Bacteroidetes bacterium GWE2_29_8]|nr:MAG: hypothetical protein A2X12_01110 [Bacteroidetes bacterium GWE2_29_8]OFY14411.1 MAG: hypothetical protein A2X02_01245 [Bacteroidetes bacterium GWF2_29_10]